MPSSSTGTICRVMIGDSIGSGTATLPGRRPGGVASRGGAILPQLQPDGVASPDADACPGTHSEEQPAIAGPNPSLHRWIARHRRTSPRFPGATDWDSLTRLTTSRRSRRSCLESQGCLTDSIEPWGDSDGLVTILSPESLDWRPKSDM